MIIVSPNMGTFTISYDNLNRRETLTMGNGIAATYTFDDASQLQSIVFKDGTTPITSNEYPLYDDVGNRKTEIDLAGTHNYTYDELYRLKTATHPSGSGNPDESFNYDFVGNRTDSHLSASYTTDELNRLTEDDNYTYGYDADGNLISKTSISTSASTLFHYNAENKLVKVDKYDSTPTLISSSTYGYDGFGRRVKKSVDGVVTYYVYDMEDIRFGTDGLGNITAEYVHGPGIDEPLAMRRNGSNYYYHVNGLGSITALTDSSKTVVQSYVYDSFGQIISQTGSITNPYTYTAREYDPETGMYYYRARYYDAKMGRFITTDPLNLAKVILLKQSDSRRVRYFANRLYWYGLTHPQVLNEYLYVTNRPINWVDPWGLISSATGWAGVISGGIGSSLIAVSLVVAIPYAVPIGLSLVAVGGVLYIWDMIETAETFDQVDKNLQPVRDSMKNLQRELNQPPGPIPVLPPWPEPAPGPNPSPGPC